MGSESVRGIDRRRLVKWGGLAAAGAVAAAPLVSAGISDAGATFVAADRIPSDTLPGGAYDRYVAQLAAAGKFSGVVLLSHRGRTVLSRSYGMADRERSIPNRESTAFSLSSAGKPFHAVAILQLAQQGKLQLTDSVGTHLTGFPADIAEQVTIHHLLAGVSGLNAPDEEVHRTFQSREEVHRYYEHRARQAKLVGIPGLPDTAHEEPEVTISALIVEAVTGMTYWDFVQKNIFQRCGMTSSAFYTRPRWLTDIHIAHPYMTLAGGSVVDALRNLDKSSSDQDVLGKNPGRAYIDAPGDGGFATAPDLVRFAHALADGTVLDRAWADVFTAAKIPLGSGVFAAYGPSVSIANGQWEYQRAGGNPGVGANWSIYPYTGWVAVTLINCDGVPLQDLLAQETQAITGAPVGGGAGG